MGGVVLPDVRYLLLDKGQLLHGRLMLIQDETKKYLSRNPTIKDIWHTHPNQAKPYPSAEDLVKVLLNCDIDSSTVFTPIGMWIIRYPHSLPEILNWNVYTEKIDTILHNTLYKGLYQNYKELYEQKHRPKNIVGNRFWVEQYAKTYLNNSENILYIQENIKQVYRLYMEDFALGFKWYDVGNPSYLVYPVSL